MDCGPSSRMFRGSAAAGRVTALWLALVVLAAPAHAVEISDAEAKARVLDFAGVRSWDYAFVDDYALEHILVDGMPPIEWGRALVFLDRVRAHHQRVGSQGFSWNDYYEDLATTAELSLRSFPDRLVAYSVSIGLGLVQGGPIGGVVGFLSTKTGIPTDYNSALTSVAFELLGHWNRTAVRANVDFYVESMRLFGSPPPSPPYPIQGNSDCQVFALEGHFDYVEPCGRMLAAYGIALGTFGDFQAADAVSDGETIWDFYHENIDLLTTWDAPGAKLGLRSAIVGRLGALEPIYESYAAGDGLSLLPRDGAVYVCNTGGGNVHEVELETNRFGWWGTELGMIHPGACVPADIDSVADVVTIELDVDGMRVSYEPGPPAPVVAVMAGLPVEPVYGPAAIALSAEESLVLEDDVMTRWVWSFSDDTRGVAGESVDVTIMGPGVVTVTLTVETANGHTAEATSDIEILNPVRADASVFPLSGDAPLDVDFDAGPMTRSETGDITGYEWDFGDGASAIVSSLTHTYTISGDLRGSLTATDSNGYEAVDEFTLAIESPVNAVFIPSTFEVFVDEEVTFDGSVSSSDTGSELVRYDWNFGDNSTASGPIVTHAFTTADKIRTVTLTVTDENGLQGIDSRSFAIHGGVGGPYEFMGGTIRSNVQWGPALSPITVRGSLTIADGGQLRILSGAEVELQSGLDVGTGGRLEILAGAAVELAGANLEVRGELSVRGEPGNPARIAGSGCDTGSVYSNAIWVKNGGRATFDHADLRQMYQLNAESNSSLTVADSVLDELGDVIVSSGSRLSLTDSMVSNWCSTGVSASGASGVQVAGTTFAQAPDHDNLASAVSVYFSSGQTTPLSLVANTYSAGMYVSLSGYIANTLVLDASEPYRTHPINTLDVSDGGALVVPEGVEVALRSRLDVRAGGRMEVQAGAAIELAGANLEVRGELSVRGEPGNPARIIGRGCDTGSVYSNAIWVKNGGRATFDHADLRKMYQLNADSDSTLTVGDSVVDELGDVLVSSGSSLSLTDSVVSNWCSTGVSASGASGVRVAGITFSQAPDHDNLASAVNVYFSSGQTTSLSLLANAYDAGMYVSLSGYVVDTQVLDAGEPYRTHPTNTLDVSDGGALVVPEGVEVELRSRLDVRAGGRMEVQAGAAIELAGANLEVRGELSVRGEPGTPARIVGRGCDTGSVYSNAIWVKNGGRATFDHADLRQMYQLNAESDSVLTVGESVLDELGDVFVGSGSSLSLTDSVVSNWCSTGVSASGASGVLVAGTTLSQAPDHDSLESAVNVYFSSGQTTLLSLVANVYDVGMYASLSGYIVNSVALDAGEPYRTHPINTLDVSDGGALVVPEGVEVELQSRLDVRAGGRMEVQAGAAIELVGANLEVRGELLVRGEPGNPARIAGRGCDTGSVYSNAIWVKNGGRAIFDHADLRQMYQLNAESDSALTVLSSVLDELGDVLASSGSSLSLTDSEVSNWCSAGVSASGASGVLVTGTTFSQPPDHDNLVNAVTVYFSSGQATSMSLVANAYDAGMYVSLSGYIVDTVVLDAGEPYRTHPVNALDVSDGGALVVPERVEVELRSRLDVRAGGRMEVQAGATIELAGANLEVRGELSVRGEPGNPARIVGSGCDTGSVYSNAIWVKNGGRATIDHANLREMYQLNAESDSALAVADSVLEQLGDVLVSSGSSLSLTDSVISDWCSTGVSASGASGLLVAGTIFSQAPERDDLESAVIAYFSSGQPNQLSLAANSYMPGMLIHLSGTLSGAASLEPGGHHFLTSGLTVTDTSTLSLPAGAVLDLGGHDLSIVGTLASVGIPSNPAAITGTCSSDVTDARWHREPRSRSLGAHLPVVSDRWALGFIGRGRRGCGHFAPGPRRPLCLRARSRRRCAIELPGRGAGRGRMARDRRYRVACDTSPGVGRGHHSMACSGEHTHRTERRHHFDVCLGDRAGRPDCDGRRGHSARHCTRRCSPGRRLPRILQRGRGHDGGGRSHRRACVPRAPRGGPDTSAHCGRGITALRLDHD